jgi:hypothetical protein
MINEGVFQKFQRGPTKKEKFQNSNFVNLTRGNIIFPMRHLKVIFLRIDK